MKRAAMVHTKLLKLQRRLQLPQWGAVGLLECLWHLTAREAPRGDIGRLSNEDIALGISWTGDADALMEALIECGWLDPDTEHRLLVHDWHDHADDATRKYVARNKLGFASERVRKVGTEPDKSGEVGTDTDVSGNVETCLDMSIPARVNQSQSQKPETHLVPDSREGASNSEAGGVAVGETEPDGTQPIPEGDLQRAESLCGQFSRSHTLDADTLFRLRRLLADGMTFPEFRQIVEDLAKAKPDGWKASSFAYFVKTAERIAAENPAGLGRSPPAELASALPEWSRDRPRPANYGSPELLDDLPPL